MSAPTGSSGSACAIGGREFADGAVDHVPRSAAPGGEVDRIELAQAQDMLGVDRVGVAQPVLDLGDRKRGRPRLARRPRRGLLAAARFRAAGRARAPRRDISRRARSTAFQRASPATAASRCTKRDSTVGAPATLAARVRITSRAPSICAKSCAESEMRRSGRSRPSSRRIGRLSQASLLVSGGQVPSLSPPSTTRSMLVRRASSGPRMRTRTPGCPGRRTTRSPMMARKQLGIVGERDMQICRPSGSPPSSSSTDASAVPSTPAKAAGAPAAVVGKRRDDGAVALREVGQAMGAGAQAFEIAERGGELDDEVGRGLQFVLAESVRADRTDAGRCARARLSLPSSARIVASACAEALRSGTRPRAAQHGTFERRDGAVMRPCGARRGAAADA